MKLTPEQIESFKVQADLAKIDFGLLLRILEQSKNVYCFEWSYGEQRVIYSKEWTEYEYFNEVVRHVQQGSKLGPMKLRVKRLIKEVM